MWDKYDALHDEEENKLLFDIIKTEKQAVQAIQKTYLVNFGQELVEPNDEIVAFGALSRCCTCLGSMLCLVRNGYVGSANALLRQAYELLVWSKMAVDTYDEEVLIQLHDGFYDNDLRAKTFKSFLNRISYEINDATLSREMIVKEGIEIYSQYASFTHAGRWSQQALIQTVEFADTVKACLGDIAVWIECLFSLTCKFRKKCLDALCDRDSMNEADRIRNCRMYSIMIENVYKYRNKLFKYFDDIDSTVICRAFADTNWVVK